jgi:serine-protein kinase ATM
MQIGNHVTPLAQSLMACETSYLLRLSRAAREVGHSQIAINAVVKAQNLNGREHFEVACEFANVLWLSKEPQIATEFLKGLLSTVSQSSSSPHTGLCSQASLLALMVRSSTIR